VTGVASTVWRGNIAFGLVSIPVRLVRAARRERIQFRQVYKAEPVERDFDPVERDFDDDPTDDVETPSTPVAPVQRVHTAAASSEAELIRPAEILKGFEVEPNRYVTFKADEVKAIKPKTSTTIEITSFIHLDEIDPLYFDASYYVAPQPAGEKPYAILFDSLAHSKFTALGQMAMHGREHAVVIRTGAKGLILETLFYQNEVHLEDQIAVDPKLAAPNELKMAEAFIQAMSAKFNPEELVDQYEKRMKAMIDSRAASASAAPETAEKRTGSAPVVDIMEALRKSLEQVRKPAAKETRAKRSRVS
jgi:DNA end-binding protein Ku